MASWWRVSALLAQSQSLLLRRTECRIRRGCGSPPTVGQYTWGGRGGGGCVTQFALEGGMWALSRAEVRYTLPI